MRALMQNRLAVAVLAGIAAADVRAQVVVEELGPGYLPTDCSSNGTVVVGNIEGPYETFYWTSETGPLPLGRATVPVIGVGAGTPGVSFDGSTVSATILTDDDLYATQGIWDSAHGWRTLMPPPPADGGVLDSSYGSAWGISGDGQTVVGLYWRPNHSATGSAHPSAATVAGGVVDLGTPYRSGRANCASYDGSVIGGWVERQDGTWQPAVWVDGVRTVLGNFEAFTSVEGVNGAGTILAGESYTAPDRGATLWHWNGTGWDRQFFGGLPGMVAFQGNAWFDSVSGDGGVAVGATRFSFGSSTAGMIWMPDLELVEANDWLALHGATTDHPLIQITDVSEDGRTMLAIAQQQVPPFSLYGVVIHCSSDGDFDGDGDVDLRDAAALQRAYTGPAAGGLAPETRALDFNCDLDVDLSDLGGFAKAMTGPHAAS